MGRGIDLSFELYSLNLFRQGSIDVLDRNEAVKGQKRSWARTGDRQNRM